MAQLAVWLLLCLIIAVPLRTRGTYGVCLVLVLWAAVPATAASRVTGQDLGLLGMHPATWLTFTLAAAVLLTDFGRHARTLGQHPYAVIALSVFVAGAVLTTLDTASGGVKLLGDMIVAPLLLFWLLVTDAHRDPAKLKAVRNTFLAVAVAESLLAVAQFGSRSLLVYAADFRDVSWFNPDRLDRWMGTTDSPLVLSFAICLAAPLVVSLRHSWLQVPIVVVLLMGIVTTQSRVGIVMMGLILVYLLVRARIGRAARVLYLTLMATAAVVLANSPLSSGVASRLPDDGSAGARLLALETFFDQFLDHLLTGEGLTSSYRVAQEAGLNSSLESSFLMFAIDTGVIMAALFFGTQVLLVLLNLPDNMMRGAAAAALVACLVQQTFSAAGFSNLTGAFAWVAVGLVVASSRRLPVAGRAVSAPLRRPLRVG